MAKLLKLLIVTLCATVAVAMPRDQQVNAVAPPAPQAQITYEQYVTMPIEERQVFVELLTSDELTSPWSWLKCEVCKKGIGFFEGKIASIGCGAGDAIAVAACEAAGLGPEDPLADVCAAAFVAGCGEIVRLIEGHVSNPTTVCKDIHMC
eukprot:GILI01016354.1.p1 GENE.GILI01016354.1~~GILI01016354.1.p1  ORF type:complete len:150 (+),score=22.76 GILI01016354.1:40-489(+)